LQVGIMTLISGIAVFPGRKYRERRLRGVG
jgi:hypothetical protein